MAIICRDLRLLFVQTPHTASSAVGEVLRERLGGRWLPEEHIRDERGAKVLPKKHATLRQLMAGGLITKEERGNLLVVAGVRNPYDVVVTAYARVVANRDRRLVDDGEGDADLVDKRRSTPAFETYVRQRFAPNLPDRIRGSKPFQPVDFAAEADRVIRFERLQEDFDDVMRRIGVIEHIEIPFINVTVGRAGRDYREYYTPKARRIVEHVYGDQLRRYGYGFEGRV